MNINGILKDNMMKTKLDYLKLAKRYLINLETVLGLYGILKEILLN